MGQSRRRRLLLGSKERLAKPGPKWSHLSWPILPEPFNPGRALTQTELRAQRAIFIALVVAVNLGLGTVTIFADVDYAPLLFALFFKLQDCLMALITIACLAWTLMASLFRKPTTPVSRQWVLSLLPAYNESEEQILKAIRGLDKGNGAPHAQVILVVVDGHHKDILGEFSRVVADFERPYHSLKHEAGTLKITAGFFSGHLPVIIIEKLQNAGKKDTLVLTHDLFNYPRDNMPEYTRLLREELRSWVLPALTEGTDFRSFNMIFCTDADSLIHDGCIMKLIDGLASDTRAIAACGLVLVEFEPGYEWSAWNFFQLTQYAYGQFVNRWAESFMGKVTCLPGCVTMIAVRPEMAGAIAKYAQPVVKDLVVHHQVQNLGTDRRLTYCMLSQNKKLRTIFVPDAVAETLAPQSFKHYLQQRRRWGSNSYFNNFFYCGGSNQNILTRFIALIHILCQTAVFYRILNIFLTQFRFIDVPPLLVITQFPTLWFCVCVLTQRALRVRAHKILVGFIINKVASPIMSSVIFAVVMANLGNAAWGISGTTATTSLSDLHKPSAECGPPTHVWGRLLWPFGSLASSRTIYPTLTSNKGLYKAQNEME